MNCNDDDGGVLGKYFDNDDKHIVWEMDRKGNKTNLISFNHNPVILFFNTLTTFKA